MNKNSNINSLEQNQFTYLVNIILVGESNYGKEFESPFSHSFSRHPNPDMRLH